VRSRTRKCARRVKLRFEAITLENVQWRVFLSLGLPGH
jgi:hypothetical protein